jgi:peptidoglycan/xylan/chitin deacetylase (PgdA/CDA1 family)
MPRRRAVMSIDVEDWFQVENLRGVIDRESWDDRERRVVANTERILAVFARTGTRAPFFCLGWIAEREPELIRKSRRRAMR